MPLSDPAAVLCILLICILPLALAGLALLNTGLSRARSAAHLLLGAVCLTAVAAVLYYAFGFAWQGYPGGPSYALGSANWDWIGAQKFFFHGLHWNGASGGYIAAYQLFAVALAAIIPWGAGADRWRLSAAAVSTVVLAGLIYPIFAHWVWGGGWLSHLGIGFGLGTGFVDPGGAATIQVIGGIAALSVVWIAGPRSGKFAPGGATRPIPGHNIIYVLLGCLMALVGWLALNTLGAVLFAGMTGAALLVVEINTLLCAAAALLLSVFVTRVRFGKPDAALAANGWIAGLVVSSAVAAYVSPAFAILSGAIAGAGLPFAVEFLETACGVDDPAAAVAVHGVCGLWGLFALGIFSPLPAGQTLAQLVGIGTLVGLMLPVIYFINWLLNRFVLRFRADAEGERVGMDLHELGAGAYPEFALRGDDLAGR